MYHLNFRPCLANQDVWMRTNLNSYGSKHCERVLLHVHDALVTSKNAKNILRIEIENFELKEELIIPPKMCLGGSARKVVLVEAWDLSSS